MRVGLLGPLEVRDGTGAVVPVGGARLRALLGLLALRAGRVVPAAWLIDALRPGPAPPGAPNALQAQISRLRRTVPGLAVTARDGGYRLDLAPDEIDVHRFERLATRGRARLTTDPAGAVEVLGEALALWRGPVLLDLTGPVELGPAARELVRSTAVHLEERRLTAVEDRATALATLRTGTPSTSSPARSPAPPPSTPVRNTNLRARLTSFIGRESELDTVVAMVGGHRLVTLTGPGGAGKTRLAEEVADRLLSTGGTTGDPFDGVWVVELAGVSDGAGVVPAVLAALGVRERAFLSTAQAGQPTRPEATSRARGYAAELVERVVEVLAGRRVVLVVDNCEHLVGDVAAVVEEVLGACAGVRVVATSREALGISGEVLWPVEPLAVPPVGAERDPDGLVAFPAVRLLVERVRAVRPGFALGGRPGGSPGGGTAGAVARVCRALDGIPLAIELAAARFRALAPEEVAARLDDRFRLLTGGSRTALPRHRTLRAVVDWSWDLLDGPERVLWRRLSVFAGGATLAAVEGVCAGGEVAPGGVLDLVTGLVERSLALVRPGPTGPRYHLLESLRAYGAERLAEAGEADGYRRAHARWFLRLADAADRDMLGAAQLDWLNRLAADHDNLRAAIRGALAAGDRATAIGLVGALGWYWWLRNHQVEGTTLIAEVLDGGAGSGRPGRAGRAAGAGVRGRRVAGHGRGR